MRKPDGEVVAMLRSLSTSVRSPAANLSSVEHGEAQTTRTPLCSVSLATGRISRGMGISLMEGCCAEARVVKASRRLAVLKKGMCNGISAERRNCLEFDRAVRPKLNGM